jgi:vacuolar-type H+-ATPase subunit D/Vma8
MKSAQENVSQVLQERAREETFRMKKIKEMQEE